jgi:hypothetical protein
MDAHHLGARVRRISVQRLIGLVMLSLMIGFFTILPLLTRSSTTHAAGGVQINAGGPAVSPFIADTDFTGGTTSSTTHAITTSGVTNPAYEAQR